MMADANTPDPPVTEHHLTVKRTARYCVLGEVSAAVRDVWFVCHGFAQLARTFLEEFRVLARPDRLIVAPEALNRFYLNREGGRAGASARVGATWMTREDRLAEIDDYVRYLDDLHRETIGPSADRVARVTALGYSQGTATAARWLVHGATRIDRLILWAGLLPPEIDPSGPARDRLSSADVTLVAGTRDEMLPAEQVRAQRGLLERAGVACRVIEFDGGHRVDQATLERIAAS